MDMEMLKKGEIKDHFEVLGAVSTKTFTVPDGKIWLVFGGMAERDTSADFSISLFNEADKDLRQLHYTSAAATDIQWGVMRVATVQMSGVFLMKAGWYLKYTWGAQQTSPEVGLFVLELPA